MKALKIIALLILFLIGVLIGVALYFKVKLTPSYEGEAGLAGLTNDVEVYYTEYGIPHIYAEKEEDAYRALGYVHAKDRLWQMELLRHVGGGSLSELFGPDLVETDIFLRTIGIREYARTNAEALSSSDSKIRRLSEAYLDGINHFIATGPGTLEHRLLGVEIVPFELNNMFEVLGYMSFSFAHAQRLDPLITDLYQKLDSVYLQDLPLFQQPIDIKIPVTNGSLPIAEMTTAVLDKMPLPLFIGSNSWVLGPDKTTTGNTILANDPHIGFAQPAVWYEAHLSHEQGEYYGYFLGGYPFPPLMHNPDAATGLTMFENDDIDFFVEKINPDDTTQYWFENEWRDFEYQQEKIVVKDGDDIDFTIVKSHHGPVISNILGIPIKEKVTMHWVYTHHANKSFEATYLFTGLKEAEEAQETASLIHAPGLNVMFGSNQGEYAWWASGGLIYRENELVSKTFRDGSTGLEEADSLRPFDQNPRAMNPVKGYTYSANNQPDAVNGIYYSGYYLPDDRGERIVEILDSQEKFSVDDVKKMLLDNTSILFREIKPFMLSQINESDNGLKTELTNWDGSFQSNSIAATVFQKWAHETITACMRDEMDSAQWDVYLQTNLFKRAIEVLIKNENSVWWDNVTTEVVETRDEIISMSYTKSIEVLKEELGDDWQQWQWEKVHSLTHEHALGANPTLAKYFNVGPFPVAATNEVINNLGFKWTSAGEYQTSFGPSTRRIVDLSDPRNNSWSILPTGQSGVLFSPYYDDQAAMYVQGEFRKMVMNEEEIKRDGSLLKLLPPQ